MNHFKIRYSTNSDTIYEDRKYEQSLQKQRKTTRRQFELGYAKTIHMSIINKWCCNRMIGWRKMRTNLLIFVLSIVCIQFLVKHKTWANQISISVFWNYISSVIVLFSDEQVNGEKDIYLTEEWFGCNCGVWMFIRYFSWLILLATISRILSILLYINTVYSPNFIKFS